MYPPPHSAVDPSYPSPLSLKAAMFTSQRESSLTRSVSFYCYSSSSYSSSPSYYYNTYHRYSYHYIISVITVDSRYMEHDGTGSTCPIHTTTFIQGYTQLEQGFQRCSFQRMFLAPEVHIARGRCFTELAWATHDLFNAATSRFSPDQQTSRDCRRCRSLQMSLCVRDATSVDHVVYQKLAVDDWQQQVFLVQ